MFLSLIKTNVKIGGCSRKQYWQIKVDKKFEVINLIYFYFEKNNAYLGKNVILIKGQVLNYIAEKEKIKN